MTDDICICIPTLNESESIKQVITEFQIEGYDNILVIDGGSTDNTREIAKSTGAKVHTQTWGGAKGSAMRETIELIDTDIIVFVDGDLTYDTSDINKLINPIIEDNVDHVLANRLDNLEPQSMSKLHFVGNKIINYTFYLLYGKYVYDILTGYRALNMNSVENLDLQSRGFDIETELTSKSIIENQTIKVISSTYYKRKGSSELQSFKDGFKIIRRMITERF